MQRKRRPGQPSDADGAAPSRARATRRPQQGYFPGPYDAPRDLLKAIDAYAPELEQISTLPDQAADFLSDLSTALTEIMERYSMPSDPPELDTTAYGRPALTAQVERAKRWVKKVHQVWVEKTARNSPFTGLNMARGDANDAAEAIFRFTLQHTDMDPPPLIRYDTAKEDFRALRLWCLRTQRIWNRLARDKDLSEAERLVYQGQVNITAFGTMQDPHDEGRPLNMPNGAVLWQTGQCSRPVYGPRDLSDDICVFLQEGTMPSGQRSPRPVERLQHLSAGLESCRSDQDKSRPETDLISSAVAVKDYSVSRATLRRAVEDKRLRDYRPEGHSRNAPLRLSRAEVANIWPKRGQ